MRAAASPPRAIAPPSARGCAAMRPPRSPSADGRPRGTLARDRARADSRGARRDPRRSPRRPRLGRRRVIRRPLRSSPAASKQLIAIRHPPHPATLKASLAGLWADRHFIAYKLPGAERRFGRRTTSPRSPRILQALVRRPGRRRPRTLAPVRRGVSSNPASLRAAFGYYRPAPVPTAAVPAQEDRGAHGGVRWSRRPDGRPGRLRRRPRRNVRGPTTSSRRMRGGPLHAPRAPRRVRGQAARAPVTAIAGAIRVHETRLCMPRLCMPRLCMPRPFSACCRVSDAAVRGRVNP